MAKRLLTQVRHLAWLVLVPVAGLVVALGLFVWFAWQDLHTPMLAEHDAKHVILHVKQGARLRPVLQELHDQGVLRHPQWLYAYARLRGLSVVQSGTYDIAAGQSPLQILTMLQNGKVMLESITVAEGLNRWQVRDLLVSGGWISAAQFDALCDDQAFLAQHQIPGPSCDGYLFAETYHFARGIAPKGIFQTFFTTYQQVMQNMIHQFGRGPLGFSNQQLTTLASIVEKETGAEQERPHIACVFYNRLRAQPAWRLETDPTVVYAATLQDPGFDGNLTRYHLHQLKSPYNTYRVYGLPPGPIANPGRAALLAVLQPATCADFFFVSRNNGTHVFCPTLECHQKAVQTWQVRYFKTKRP